MIEFCNGRIVVKTGDITREHVDAIVNAANSGLMGGGGVDGAIHRSGGSDILDECKKIRRKEYIHGLPTGQAVATTAGKLRSNYVIHTVGPVWRGGSQNEEKLLGDCYSNSLKVAVEKCCKTVAFPAISTGVFHFPKKRAAVIASETVIEFLASNESLNTVIFVFFNGDDEKIFLDSISIK